MILAFDTYYFDNKAKTVCISFESWTETKNFDIYSEVLEDIEDYQSGEFYKRELPCILSLLESIDIDKIDFIVVDGFVFLDDDYKLGLGGHLYEQLDKEIPIIGVAKSNFATLKNNKRILHRGESQKPLYITSIGIDLDIAMNFVNCMSGNFRIPTLLKELDRLTKE